MAKPLPFGAALSKAGEPAPAQAIAMTYDWLNRQTRWSDGTRTESTVFAGADWKRASTTVSGAGVAAQTTKYLYDGDNVLVDYDASNALTAFYVTPGLDQNLSISDASGQTAYYTHDGLGSVRLLTSANGAILNRYDYTAFGETFAPNTATTTTNRYTYTAREQSPLAAHGAPMCYRWRNYAPEVGRFMWRDPAVYEGSIDGNVYSYVQDRVAISSDAYGLWMSGVHTELTQIGYKQAKYAMPLSDIYLKAAVEANVATDGSGFMAKYWGSVEFAFQGFNDSEAIKHYMVGEEAIRSSVFQARRQQLLEFQQLDSFQHQELLQQYYGPNPSLPLPPFPTDHDSLGARKKAKKEAEERINEYMNLASAIWRAASKIPVKEVRMTACKQGWEYFGTALHTRQDEFSHTRGDGLPMTSIEHGWGLKYDRRGKNENRYKEALGKTTQIFKDVEKLANPYQDMCMNCITIK